MDKTEKKVERNAGKGKVVRERKAAWEELNGKIKGRKEDKHVEKEEEGEEWEDESMAEDVGAEEDAVGVLALTGEAEAVEVSRSPDRDEDDIL
ncbi:MAG: hypothetical protein M1830_007294 [Pleopsidium flavum]|nr:MAG: hypothetical protein M1830_007294 [Pleopsidium flavum]